MYRKIEASSREHCCRWGGVGGEISIKYYECVCVCVLALVTQHAKRSIILSSVACLALPYFSTLSYLVNGTGKKLLSTLCVL